MTDKNWEFECPQFYDFCSGVEGDTQEICFGGNSPALGKQRFPFKSTGHFQLKNKCMKWNYKLSTPCDKSPFVNVCPRSNTTDSEKLNARVKRLSKSEGSVNSVKINLNAQVSFYPSLQKRSTSDSNLKKEKKKIPVTPMCLKRTIHKAKSKKIKTSEELELEKIAELQSLTLKHLRCNEITLKKLRLKQKPNFVSKMPAKIDVEEKCIKKFQKDNETIEEKMNHTRNIRSKIKESSVNETYLNRARLKAVSNSSDVLIPSKLLQSFASIHLDEIKAANSAQDIAQLELPLKYTAHSGLFFSMNNSKKAALKPFNFLEKTKNVGSEKLSNRIINASKKENVLENKAQYSHSLYASHLGNGNKENELTLKTPHTDASYAKKNFKTHNSRSLYAPLFKNRNKENDLTLKILHTDASYDKKAFKFH